MSFQLSGRAPEIYENVMVPLWFGRWAEALIDLVEPKKGENILDVACGTGVTTRLLKEKVGANGHVAGLDINAGMLVKARELATELDIEFIESDVVDTKLKSNSFSAVISQHGYHYFPDQAAALSEFYRVLTPKGRIAISIWDGHSVYTEAICHAVEKFISPEIARIQRSQRITPSASDLTKQLSDAKFTKVEIVRQQLNIKVPKPSEFVPLHLGSMPIAQAFIDLPDDQKNALISDVENSMNDYINGDQMMYPDAANVATGIKG
jgi:ubiquinone/menaquinone biosynthesis C-methylase UbiE